MASLAVVGLFASGCAEAEDPPVPLEDEYTWTIQSGRVCAPTQAHTGSDDDVPVRYEFCLYRCLGLSGPFDHQWGWSCTAGTCQFDLLPSWDVEQVVNETDCDARDLLAPSEDECNMLSFDYNLSPPKNDDGDYVERSYVMNSPYLDLDQSKEFKASIQDGNGFRDSLDTVLGGLQVISERQFTIDLSTAAPVATHADLTDDDCHDIPLP
jgi:hypothetical protein